MAADIARASAAMAFKYFSWYIPKLLFRILKIILSILVPRLQGANDISPCTTMNPIPLAYLSSVFCMMTSSNGTIFRVTGPLCGDFTGPGEFPAQWPVTRSFDVFFDLRLNKRLSKQPWGWWFETPPWSLWGQCNGIGVSMLFSGGVYM